MNDRYASVLEQIRATYRRLRVERARTAEPAMPTVFSSAPPSSTVLSSVKTLVDRGACPSLSVVREMLHTADNWTSMRTAIDMLREMRFLGAPRRRELSVALLRQLGAIYAQDANDEALVQCLAAALIPMQTSCIVSESLDELLSEDASADANLVNPDTGANASSDALRTVLHTAHDILHFKRDVK